MTHNGDFTLAQFWMLVSAFLVAHMIARFFANEWIAWIVAYVVILAGSTWIVWSKKQRTEKQ